MPESRQAPRLSRADRIDVRRRAWRATFQTTHTLVGVLDQELREATGMDIQTYDTLLQTYEAGDAGIRMSDLARAVSFTKAGLTALVDRLEKRGLLERSTIPPTDASSGSGSPRMARRRFERRRGCTSRGSTSTWGSTSPTSRPK